MKMKRLMLIGLGLTASMPSLYAQNSCNHVMREKAVDPGWSGDKEDCTIIEIPGLTTPKTCTTYFSFYSSAVYTCTGPQSNGIDCHPQGYKVKTISGVDGSCPGAAFGEYLSEIDEMSDLWGLPGALATLTKCVPTKKSNSFDWSAKNSPCGSAGQTEVASAGSTMMSAGGREVRIALSAAQDEYSASLSINPFLSEYDLAQDGDPATVAGAMGDVLLHHGEISAIEFAAKVRIEFVASGEVTPNHVQASGIRGKIRRDGLFDLTKAQIITFEDEPILAVDNLTFDGSALTWRDGESPYGSIWSVESPTFKEGWSLFSDELMPIYSWCFDPFTFPLFAQGVAFQETTDQATGHLVAYRDVTGSTGLQYTCTEYVIDDSIQPMHPIAMVGRTPTGAISLFDEFSDYFEVSEGIWRPKNLKRTYFLDANPNGKRIVVKLKIVDANILSEEAEANVPALVTKKQVWQVWQ